MIAQQNRSWTAKQQVVQRKNSNDCHRHSDATLHSSNLTTSGIIAGEAVQLLVDTGACLSVIDEKFLQKIYGPFSPKMTDGFQQSIQIVNGERVPVLGKITVPIELNGREFVSDFHVMQNLAYDAILNNQNVEKRIKEST